MKRIFALSLVLFLALAFLPHVAAAQNAGDPFSDPVPIATKTRPKREKVVVHVPTLDLSFRWLEMNKGLVHIQRRVSQVKREIKSLKKDAPNKESADLERRLGELNKTYETTRQVLDRIPLDSTFDLERWQQFRKQLWEYRMAEETRIATEDAIQNENARLRNENRELRAEIERLKSGR